MAFERVLVVDDNRYSRKGLVAQLLDLDFEVEWADSARTALDLLERDYFNLVVTRLLMPVMDGWTLLEAVKNLPKYSREGAESPPPFLYTTTHRDASIQERAEHAGFAGFLLKPIEQDRLKFSLRKALLQREDEVRFHLLGSDASLLKSLAERFSMEPSEMVALLVEEISLCGMDETVSSGKDLREFLLSRLRDNLLFLPEKVA
ncbi:MAG: response regulator [Candidatus Omnitrophica bacterium]|nr:response regulator [Candidatus Omnitrophota bacterium]MCB9770866.1 response regulator [Candidatus Omnitrophota bacterium]